jgi:hypothetical protein
MAWVTTSSGSNKHWVWNSTYSGLTRTITAPTNSSTSLSYTGITKTFSPEKTYLFRTKVDNFDNSLSYKRLEIAAFGFTFSYQYNAVPNSTLPLSSTSYDTYLNWYVKPSTLSSGSTYVRYHADYNEFGTQSGVSTVASVIQEFSLTEFDWIGQGWTIATSSNSLENSKYEGWRFNESDESFQFYHRQENDSTRRKPAGGYTASNYVGKFITYDEFNLDVYFDTSNNTLGFLDVYLSNSVLSSSLNATTFTQSLNSHQKIATFTASGTYSFYKLTGNRYLNFVANYSNSNTSYNMSISNIVIQGGYQLTDNNEQFLFTNTDEYYEPTPLSIIGSSLDATYSTIITTRQTLHNPTGSVFFGATGNPGFYSNIYGSVINLSQQTSKIGNGTFRAGVWENGVWNSGWRVDENVYDLSDIVASFNILYK